MSESLENSFNNVGHAVPISDTPGLADEELSAIYGDELHALGLQLRSRVGKVVVSLFVLGHHMKHAKAELVSAGRNSEWSHWLTAYTTIEYKTANRFLNSYTAFEKFIAEDGGINKLPSYWNAFYQTALYELSRRSVSDEVRGMAVALARAGQRVTPAVVQELLQAEAKIDQDDKCLQQPFSIDEYGEGIPSDVREGLEWLHERELVFPTIVMDPPWEYRNSGGHGAAANHYGTMSTEKLAGLPVEKVAADDAFLHLWCPATHIAEALFLIEQYGFDYVSQSVWVKPSIGKGAFWRMSHELCLLAKRGNPRFLNKSFGSWFEAARRGHSSKPKEFRDRVEAVCSGPYLELFGRGVAPEGWVVIGDEAIQPAPTGKVQEPLLLAQET